MTEHDRTEFASLIVGIAEVYGEPLSDARMELYFAALADLNLTDLRRAATAHIRRSKFFPRPSELREAVHGSIEDRAELSWAEVQDLVRRYGYPGIDGRGTPPQFSDEATRRAALELCGGWPRLCMTLPGEGPELLGYAKQFKATYRAVTNQSAPPLLSNGDATVALDHGASEVRDQRLPSNGGRR